MQLGRGSGPSNAKIMLVGEAWGEEEARKGEPFVGVSGQELNRMLHEAGIMRSEVWCTNVINARPPNNDISHWIAEKKKDWTPAHRELRGRMCLPIVHEGLRQLEEEVRLVNPNVIVAAGNTPLWALTGATGILKWRGSMLQARFVGGEPPPKVLPIIHPAAVLRDWRQRAPTVRDLKRVRVASHDRQLVRPDWHFVVRPSFEQVCVCLNTLLEELNSRPEGLWLDFDLETRAGHIACAGLSWSLTDAICIPFMCVEDREGYWLPELELEIVWLLRQVLTHPNARVRGQNLLYDCQYTYKHWHFVPRVAQDTMISQHTLFSDMPKALAFQASMYAEYYVYWKDEGKTWGENQTEDQLWKYNCEDCVYTREAGEVELRTVEALGLGQVHADQQRLFWPVLQAMQRGVRVLEKGRNRLITEIQEQLALREELLRHLVGHPINPRSSQQLQKLFYEDLRQQPIFTRPKKGAPSRITCDDEALQKIGEREPLLQPITNAIADIRTLGKFLNDFVLAQVDTDGRMRCSYNIGGSESGTSAPKTYRLSSSTNAFGGGCNLQTIPSDKSKSVGKWEKRAKGVQLADLGAAYKLPNLRAMFGSDPGMTFFDMDLDRADLQVVVWEAGDEMLKAALRMGADIHLLNAFVIQGKEPPPMDELVESHPRYPDHRGPQKYIREFAKVFCHATNYVGSARTVAGHTGRTVHEIDRAQRIWFGAHPGIKQMHQRVEQQILKYRFVENRFGYRWYIFDRVEGALPEAVAWIPQSTVSNVINKAWMNIYDNAKEIEVLLQVHDSLAGQFPTDRRTECIAKLKELSRIVIPYEDPLVIPTGVKTSEVSWGECA